MQGRSEKGENSKRADHMWRGLLTMRRLALALAWALLLLIVFWTLGPVSDRPHMGGAQLERFGAYFVVGVLLSVGYDRPAAVGFFLAVFAVGLELGQNLVPGRDARLVDALAKVLGGILAAGFVAAVRLGLARWKSKER